MLYLELMEPEAFPQGSGSRSSAHTGNTAQGQHGMQVQGDLVLVHALNVGPPDLHLPHLGRIQVCLHMKLHEVT